MTLLEFECGEIESCQGRPENGSGDGSDISLVPANPRSKRHLFRCVAQAEDSRGEPPWVGVRVRWGHGPAGRFCLRILQALRDYSAERSRPAQDSLVPGRHAGRDRSRALPGGNPDSPPDAQLAALCSRSLPAGGERAYSSSRRPSLPPEPTQRGPARYPGPGNSTQRGRT
jgi:hypothetical protein